MNVSFASFSMRASPLKNRAYEFVLTSPALHCVFSSPFLMIFEIRSKLSKNNVLKRLPPGLFQNMQYSNVVSNKLYLEVFS